MIRAAAVIGSSVALAASGAVAMAAPPSSEVGRNAADRPTQMARTAPVVTTDRGAVRGSSDNGVDVFRGVRYAAAPTGALRWAPPRRAARWGGVADATRYGNRCPVTASSNGTRTENEDCLFLNVQRPTGLSQGDKRPVYVFIHGGGFVNGSSNQADGTQITRSTGAITVSINYRLGALGFLALPGLTKRQGESGNYGLMDQQAALKWVYRNIARFGGNPEQVTIGGESAGGFSVCMHLVSPASRGLFARAMVQSGNCPSRTQAEAEKAGLAFAAKAGCANGSTACLRRKPVGALVDAWGETIPLPVRGGAFLPTDPRTAVRNGRFVRVPVVVGATRDEGRTFTVANIGWTRQRYVEWVRASFPNDANAVLARYPWPATSNRFTAAYLSGAILTDSGFVFGIGGCANRALTRDFARWTPTWAYEFAHRTGPGLAPQPAGYEWGAGHAAELAYLFPSFDNGTPIAPTFDAGERALAKRMKLAWGAFALKGHPLVTGTPWPRYDRTGRILSLRSGSATKLVSDARVAAEHRCSFWDARPGQG